MAMTRIELSNKFRAILGNDNTYFDPPTGLEMHYPCIKYDQPISSSHYADGVKYIKNQRYTVTVIDEDPDSEIASRLYDEFDYCYHSTSFVSGGLHHFVYDIYV